MPPKQSHIPSVTIKADISKSLSPQSGISFMERKETISLSRQTHIKKSVTEISDSINESVRESQLQQK